MNLNTERVERQQFKNAIESKKQKYSQEYFALGVLRYLYPERYAEVVKGERPDLQGNGIGIEVTIAESEKEMQANAELKKYNMCDNKERRRKNIVKTGNEIVNNNNRSIMRKKGGVNNEEKEIFQNIIKKKMSNSLNYINEEIKHIELMILRTEIATGDFMENVIDWTKECITSENKCLYDRIYIFARDSCFICNKDGSYDKKDMARDVINKIQKIGRMTAEDILTLDDEEWK